MVRILSFLLVLFVSASWAAAKNDSLESTSTRASPPSIPSEKPKEISPVELLTLVESIRQSADDVRDYTAVLIKQEHINGMLMPRVTMRAKWARPYKIYLKNIIEPGKDREILYVRDRNQKELVAHSGSFPDLTVNLDIIGSTAMEGNHHPIDNASLLNLVDLIERDVQRTLERKKGVMHLGQDSLWGRSCKKISLHNEMVGRSHTIQDGETLWDVARKHNTSMYHILHHNRDKGWTEPDDPCAGDRVFVPFYYGGKFEVWIDAELNLPIKARVYDHFGQLYEDYEHRDLRVNIGLSGRDFDEENPAYDF